MTSVLRDMRLAVRLALKEPGFAAAAVLTLALGIGATVSIFSVMNAVLLTGLPFEAPDRLLNVRTAVTDRITAGDISSAEISHINANSETIDKIAGTFPYDATLVNSEGNAIKAFAYGVTGSFFSVLEVQPALGRFFTEADSEPGTEFYLVISYGLWQERLGGMPQIIGESVTLEGGPITVIGVAPPGFSFPEGAVAWLNAPKVNPEGAAHIWDGIARLAPGVEIESAREELSVFAGRLEEQFPRANRTRVFTVRSLLDAVIGDLRTTLTLLAVATVVLLLIACVNVANLLLSRSASRANEIAIRSALGAPAGRITRQLFTESLLLALVSGVVGLGLGYVGVRLLVAFGPSDLPRFGEITIDARVLLFTLGSAFIAALIFGLAPAFQVARANLRSVLNDASRGSSAGPGRGRFRRAMVIAELALAMVLVIQASLLMRSFFNLSSLDPGFESERLLTFEVSLPISSYPNDGDLPSGERYVNIATFFDRLMGRIENLPGVDSVAASSSLPLGGPKAFISSFRIESKPQEDPSDNPQGWLYRATPGYFRTMGATLIRGRGFEPSDRRGAPGVAVINKAFADAHFPGEDPIGERVVYDEASSGTLGERSVVSLEIVGIVENIRYSALGDDSPPALYYAFDQAPYRQMTVVVRTAVEPATLVSAIQGELAAVDSGVAMGLTRTMEQVVSDSMARERLGTLLMAIFALTALTLASIGTYGIIAYGVTQRTGEMGIRIALGAQHGEILGLIIRGGLRLAVGGVLIGLFAAWAVSRVMSSQFYGVSGTDPLVFMVVTALLALVAVAASWLPARRAARVNPQVVLRPE